MKTLQTTTHTTPNGYAISYQIRSILGIQFLQVQCNFDVVKNIHFSHYWLQCIPGVMSIWSVSINANKTGTFYFGLKSDYNRETVMNGIAHEFEAYSLSLNDQF